MPYMLIHFVYVSFLIGHKEEQKETVIVFHKQFCNYKGIKSITASR